MASWLSRLSSGLKRSRDGIAQILPGRQKETLSDQEWQDLEDALIMADCGAGMAIQLVEKARVSRETPLLALKQGMLKCFAHVPKIHCPESGPQVIMMVGVNGTGKTTTLGKITHMFTRQHKRVLIGAGDTFRAAAVEQLAIWVERAGADMVRQAEGADPAAVAFDTVQRGIARDYNVVMIDTAGRVQTDRNLMNELGKVRRVAGKAMEGAPHEVWHVVDASTGQNAVEQVRQFQNVAGTTGLIVTKLDGTAKGGVVLQLASTFNLPIRYIGVGETLEDLLPFDPDAFVQGLLPEPEEVLTE